MPKIFSVFGFPFEGTSAPPINYLGAGSIALPDGNFLSFLIMLAVATKVELSISFAGFVSGWSPTFGSSPDKHRILCTPKAEAPTKSPCKANGYDLELLIVILDQYHFEQE